MSKVVTVYTIAKNEEKHVERFMKSALEADHVVVLDTGSTDRTVELLRARGAIVEQRIIDPWRFDVARNESMKLIPEDTDICVCFDLDEILTPGWRALVEAAWEPDTVQAHYRYVWNYNADGSEGTTFTREKIHAPGVFEWRYPVHEVLWPKNGFSIECFYINGFTCEHRADDTKSRANYLPLLQLAIQEFPESDRNMHYLGREQMYYGQYSDAIETLKYHLSMPTTRWGPERCASMRFIGRCYAALGDRHSALVWFMRACAEAPHLREPWYEAEKCAYEISNWEGVVYYGVHAAAIMERQNDSYIQEPEAWGAGVWDMLSIGYWNLGDHLKAWNSALNALSRDQGNARIHKNVQFFKEYAAAHHLVNTDENPAERFEEERRSIGASEA